MSKEIDKFLQDVNKKNKKKYGAEVIYNSSNVGNFQPLPTKFPMIDYINSGIGGLPRGGMVLIHGLESTGKTTLALEIINDAIEIDPSVKVLIIDVENSITKDFLEFKRIPTENVYVSPLNNERGLDIVKDAIVRNLFDIILIDSLAKMDGDEALDKDISESKRRNIRASMLTEFFRHITYVHRKSKTVLMCINQEIENQDRKTKYEPATILPCGKQQLFSANLRLHIKRSKKIKKGDKVIGYEVTVTSLKNKISANEGAKSKLHYIKGLGFYRDLSVVEYLKDINVLQVSGGWLSFIDQKTFGETKFRTKDFASIAESFKSGHGIDLYRLPPPDEYEIEIGKTEHDIGTEKLEENNYDE